MKRACGRGRAHSQPEPGVSDTAADAMPARQLPVGTPTRGAGAPACAPRLHPLPCSSPISLTLTVGAKWKRAAHSLTRKGMIPNPAIGH